MTELKKLRYRGRPLFFITHGFMSGSIPSWAYEMKDALIGMIIFAWQTHLRHQVFRDATTLDPAGPFFDCYPNLGLTKNSALFVQVLHTDAEGLLFHFGTERQMGHIDYYVNPGQSQQPGCLIPSQKVLKK
uniref:Lipase domain-containing protein n=1 Tax=Romanomermis culicivorax TaxID=13658 RepID=A0A915IWF3_ROMCU